MQERKTRNVGFVSTRIAGTDGVSLEIEKWATVLCRNQFNCFYFAGELDRDPQKSFLTEEAHFEHPDVAAITQRLFGVEQRPRAVTDEVHALTKRLKAKLYGFCDAFGIDLLVPENALTIPMNIPLGLALTEFIAETGISTIAHHHDFYWERDRFLINGCQDYLDQAFPPNLPPIRHVVINSLASKQLSYRRGLSNTIVPNVYDFANAPEVAGDACPIRSEIGFEGGDLFVLQPTRVVPRKRIERSIEVVRQLELTDPTLVISHAAGDEGQAYARTINEVAKNAGVKLAFIDHLIGGNAHTKRYALADAYQCADLVLYPSGYEGFGNAFLEAIYYKKPIVVNRYPIFIADIEPKGFDVIKIDGNVGSKTIDMIKRVLADRAHHKSMVEKNYELGKQYFSFEVLEKKLLGAIDTLGV